MIRHARDVFMHALVYNGPRDVSIKNVPDAKIEHPTDVLVKITTTNICGSDLHMLRLDTKTGHAFITESGTGTIIVVDLKSGKARRLLANNPSTKLEPEAEIVVDGMKIIDPETGNAPAFQADGIAFDKEGGWLYYHALAAKTSIASRQSIYLMNHLRWFSSAQK
jgi:hypothetical protein